MTQEQQSKLLGEFYAEKKNILKLKGEDYANEDVLSNFKSAGSNIGISPELQCLSLIATKVARLGNLLSGKTPNNESISDSILDLSNYTDLLYCLVNEQITDEVNKPKTKRWENVAPIKDTYVPKVGDRFRTPFGEYFNIIYVGGTHCILSRVCGSLTQEFKIFHDEMHEYIKSGILRKD